MVIVGIGCKPLSHSLQVFLMVKEPKEEFDFLRNLEFPYLRKPGTLIVGKSSEYTGSGVITV